MISLSHIIVLALIISLLFWRRWLELPSKIKESLRLFKLNYKGEELDRSSVEKDRISKEQDKDGNRNKEEDKYSP